MKLIFADNKAYEVTIVKETKKYITFRCNSTTMLYRYDKVNKQVQNGTYHNVLKGLRLE